MLMFSECLIETDDFLQMARAKLGPDEPMSEVELREAFAMFDQDGSGSIDPDELRMILAGAALEDDVIEQLVHDADTDGDGEIDFEGVLLYYFSFKRIPCTNGHSLMPRYVQNTTFISTPKL